MTVELLFALPILLLVLFGGIELHCILMAQQTLTVASREGARVGAAGGDAQAVEFAVRNVLATGGPLVHADVNVQFVQVNDPNLGTITDVVVTVTAPVGLATLAVPPAVTGSLLNQTLVGQAVMQVE
jgi:Flp pilus assembly protein TadG